MYPHPQKFMSPILVKIRYSIRIFMRSTLFKMSLSLLLIQSTFAANAPIPPIACPSLTAIKSGGFNLAEQNAMVGWAAVNTKNNYNTPQDWSFAIFVGQATDANDAIAKGNIAVNLLTDFDGPTKDKDGKDEWACLYASGNSSPGQQSYFAVAVTPAIADSTMMAIKLSRKI